MSYLCVFLLMVKQKKRPAKDASGERRLSYDVLYDCHKTVAQQRDVPFAVRRRHFLG